MNVCTDKCYLAETAPSSRAKDHGPARSGANGHSKTRTGAFVQLSLAGAVAGGLRPGYFVIQTRSRNSGSAGFLTCSPGGQGSLGT